MCPSSTCTTRIGRFTRCPATCRPAKFVHAGRDRLGHATDSIVSPGVIVSGGEVHHSVLSPNVRIHSWAQIVDSVLFDGVVINRRARVYKAILDKNVVLTENSTVGIDTEHDLAVASPSRRMASRLSRRTPSSMTD